ncbi:MAG: hypothetical protein HC884_10580 [Chloroflexaceae bacterium]|nr:hypothetical protein [Chloroflexaceae bacterium]
MNYASRPRPRMVVLLLALVLLLAACQSTSSGERLVTQYQQPDEPVAFQVGAEVIPVSAYEQRLQEQVGPIIQQKLESGETREAIAQEANEHNVRQLILDQMIQEELLLWQARQEGVVIDSGEVSEAVARQQELPTPEGTATGGGEEEALTGDGQATMRREQVQQQVILTMIARHTTADAYRARHIMLSVSTPMTATQAQQQAAFAAVKPEAEKILEQVRGGADFAALAREHSEDQGSAADGGDLGWVREGDLVPQFEEAAMSAELHEPVLVETPYGYHIVVVEDRQADQPFESVDELRNTRNPGVLIDSSFVPWYEEFRKEAEGQGILSVSLDPESILLPFPKGE